MINILVSLVGHQTLPILLVIKHLQPDKVILLSSNKPEMQRRKHNLSGLLPQGISVIYAPTVDPWNIESVPQRLQELIQNEEIEDAHFICDVTGGTKAMSIGLTHFAEQHSHDMIYLESDSGDPLLQRYTMRDKRLHRVGEPTPLVTTLTIDEFLYAYLGRFDTCPHSPQDPNAIGVRFENDVRSGFEKVKQMGLIDEIKYAVKPRDSEEIDIILRKGNRFAIVECKQGKRATEAYGILQLNNLGSERHLGLYTRKIFAVAKNYREESRDNAKMADEHGVELLQLPNWELGKAWTQNELNDFIKVIETVFNR